MDRRYMFAVLFTLIWQSLIILPTAMADFELQVLHTNDMQSRFEQTDAYGNTCPDATAGTCIGGFPRLKTAIERFTKEAKDQQNIPSIFLNAGDTFQGSPYYSEFKSKIVTDLIPYLGLNAMSLGNHEFDDGVQNLVSFCSTVGVPILAANLDVQSEPELAKCQILKSTVLKVAGKDIGLIGYLTPHTKHLANTGKVIFKDEIEAIQEEAKSLKARGIDIIIALGHSGLEKDIEIAEKVPQISLIVGGHSHILMHTPKEQRPHLEPVTTAYPYFVHQKSGRRVPIVHACCNTKYLGKLRIKFNDQGDAIESSGSTFLLDGSFVEDDGLKRKVTEYKESIKTKISIPLGRTNNKLSAEVKNLLNNPESNFGNLVTDAFVHYAAKNFKEKTGWTDAAVALIQQGSIRTDIDEFKNDGTITYGDLKTSLPFENRLVKVNINGKSLKKVFEYSVKSAKVDQHYVRTEGTSKYLYTSGIRVTFNLDKPVGERVTSLSVRCAKCDGPRYFKVCPHHDANTVYTVIITDYLLNGGDGFNVFPEEAKDPKPMDVTVFDAVADYIKGEQVVYPGYTGRSALQSSTSAALSTRFSTVSVFSVALVTLIYQYVF